MGRKSWRRHHFSDQRKSTTQQNDPTKDHRQPSSDMSRPEDVSSKPPACQPSAAEEKHRADEADFWRRQLKISCGLNVITALGVVGAIFGLYFVYQGLGETKRAGDIADATLKIGNRAWLAPVTAELDGPLQKDQPIKVLIVFENTGRAPALGVFNSTGEGFTIPVSPEVAAQQQRTGPFGPAPAGGATSAFIETGKNARRGAGSNESRHRHMCNRLSA